MKCNIPLSVAGWVLPELDIVPCAEDHKVSLLRMTPLPRPRALLATCVEFEVNLAVAFHMRFGLLEEYRLSVGKCLQEFDATYVIDWDCICKGLLRGDVQMFQTFVVGSPQQHGDDTKDLSSHDEVELGNGKAVTPSKFTKTAAVKAPKPKPKAPHSDGKTPG